MESKEDRHDKIKSVPETFITEDTSENETIVVDTSSELEDGQEKCPRCGSTDISLNPNTGKLRCHFCRFEFEPQKLDDMETDISKLKGKVIGSGAQNIIADTKDMITLKCQSCGAEVVIDTMEAAQSRCHWCRNTLSINQQIPNGTIPDVVLPFRIKKEEAENAIKKFVGERQFFINPIFKKEFTTENIMGVYFPYMLVDINGHGYLEGVGEQEIRAYNAVVGSKTKKRYDVDVYKVSRKFDITINELSIESSSDRLNKTSKEKTNNIINAIMPFDTENCVKWNANYIKGYTSEKRDTNIEQLESIVQAQSRDIAKFKMNDTLKKYDRGVRWDTNQLDTEGQQWKAAYLPVWLYSYQQRKGNKSLLHYVAVNARTKETMGSVPINMPRLIAVSTVIEILSIIIMLFVDFGRQSNMKWFLLLPGIIFFSAIYSIYRNAGARHSYELETRVLIDNLVSNDIYIRTNKEVKEAKMEDANNKTLEGDTIPKDIFDSLTNIKVSKKGLDSLDKDSEVSEFLKDSIDKFSK
ncbi:TFIIB-type zinc ribbon-containing protein [Streptococcus zalophi]|uniref:TFIIB-type zinc ribbon-containing protein n=1 Tax=Streptococcus zalophi TaxID=640031 RepID=UPI00215D381B|nr:TFIIB-type zinc ribbon-containing protein [Streptococcus zalophi]MCR8967316.1 TFIIB-type zinc ribbon-containing protein [Streptococcus zalophi]